MDTGQGGCPLSLGFGQAIDCPISILLMHQDEMLTLLQIGIHRVLGKWPTLPSLAFLGSLKRFFKLQTRVGVVENL